MSTSLPDSSANVDWYWASFHVMTQNGDWTTLTTTQRFGLVSSLYGPGNLACWFCLILSVVVSWTVNPSTRRQDSITNDFIAVLTMPVVAAGHFFYLIAQQRSGSIKELLGSREEGDVMFVGALEAPLTVCEDFLIWAAVLFSLAAGRRHQKRRTLLLCVGLLCLAPEVLLMVEWVPYGSSTLLRPFLFHSFVFFWFLFAWQILTLLVYLAEVFSAVCVAAAGKFGIIIGTDAEQGCSRGFGASVLSPGWLTSRMSTFSGFVAAIGTVWVKYGWLQLGSYNSMRFIPRSPVSVLDLDQAIATLGGLVALGFSVRDAVKERKMGRQREERNRVPPWRRWGR